MSASTASFLDQSKSFCNISNNWREYRNNIGKISRAVCGLAGKGPTQPRLGQLLWEKHPPNCSCFSAAYPLIPVLYSQRFWVSHISTDGTESQGEAPDKVTESSLCGRGGLPCLPPRLLDNLVDRGRGFWRQPDLGSEFYLHRPVNPGKSLNLSVPQFSQFQWK